MKKLFTLFIISLFSMFYLAAQEWNISSENFNALGTIDTTTTVEGLTIYASGEKNVVVDANSKTLDDMEFTHRLKLGGSGDFDDNGLPLARVLAVDVDGNSVITVAGMSSSSSEDRELHVAVNHKDSILNTFPALGSEISKGIYTYTGGPATIYLYSPSSGVNIYYLEVQAEADSSVLVREWNISSEDFNALGTIDTTATIKELTIWAHSGKTVVVDENSKTIDDMEFTHRMKLGGSGEFDENGLPMGRVIAFDVSGDATITVGGMSSSSSEDRELYLAANHMDSIFSTFSALGEEISMGIFKYTGEPATIYLYSPSSGVNIYYLKVEETIIPSEEENVWNISTDSFNALGTIIETTTINGLTIWAHSEKNVVVDENNKSLDGMEFTHRLKLGGQGDFDEAGLPLGRVVSFEAEGRTRITVMAMSSSSSEDRELQLAVGHPDSIFATFTALGEALSMGEYIYEGDSATIYLYSSHSGINIYYLKVEAVITGINSIDVATHKVKVFPNPASDRVFVNITSPTQVAIYNLSGSIVKSKLLESEHDSFDISDLQPGMYIIRSQYSNDFAEKLIKR